MKKILLGTVLCVLFGFSAQAQTYIKEIEVDGLHRVERETVLSYIDIKEDTAVSAKQLDNALKNLYLTGLFSDISFDKKPGDVIVIKVVENPIINKRVFEGNDKMDDKILESEVRLGSGSIYDKAKVQDDVQRILEVYKRSGRYAAVVEPKIIKRDQNRIDLVYEIDEGPVAKISKINFSGNVRYSADDLKNTIMSKEGRWYRFFSSADTYDPDKTNYDKELLRRFYLKRGYADFRVISAIGELSPNKKSFILNFIIDEGKKYKISDIEITSRFPDLETKTMYKELEAAKGDWYDADEVEQSVYNLTEELGRRGYAFVDVVANLNKDLEKGTLKINFEIREGARIFINRINIKGNTRTEDKVIRREFRINEGDAFNATKIRASRRNVENLDYFSKVDMQTVPTEDDGKADMDVIVQEKSTGMFNIGVGYSTVNGALLRAGISESNFQGKGQYLGVDASISQRYNSYELNFTEPYFLNKRLSAGFDLFRTEQDYQDEGSYDNDTNGGRIRFGWKYTDNLSQYFRYTLREDEIKNVSSSASPYVKSEEGKYLNSAIGQTLAYDKRDSAINPTEGYYLSLSNDFAGLGGDEKYVKFDIRAMNYYTFADKYTLKLFFQGGLIDGYSGETVRLANRYYLGGYNMRGFESAGIGARDRLTGDALGGNWMVYSGVELSFPIGLDEVGIKGRTFLDIGALGKPDNINQATVDYDSTPRTAVGAGIQWMSPMGQIDVDFGFAINKEKYDNTEVFRLNFGTRF
ncbi:MAG: outer membrane protein assembly factor BamA [Lactobacillaceae bacterium]|jgi:outer membrane protein insertion porin family|nr:outer membrane protein assembly factor BamA [Lactobacillaceae bacterium]